MGTKENMVGVGFVLTFYKDDASHKQANKIADCARFMKRTTLSRGGR
jgi:hypothetical protein